MQDLCNELNGKMESFTKDTLIISQQSQSENYCDALIFFNHECQTSSVMVIIIDCTLTIIHEQLKQFQNQRKFKNNNNNKESINKLLDAQIHIIHLL